MFDAMNNNELEQMYQEVILEASKTPHGKAHFAQDITTRDAESIALEQDPSSDIGLVSTDTQSHTHGTSTVHADHESCVSAQSHQFNPTCGDEVTVRIELSHSHDGEPVRIEKLVWDGQGCSISQASLSIMYDLVHGKTLDEAMELSRLFKQLMESRGQGLDDEDAIERLDDAIVFQGVSRYPMRIKCALLGWEGLKDSAAIALSQA